MDLFDIMNRVQRHDNLLMSNWKVTFDYTDYGIQFLIEGTNYDWLDKLIQIDISLFKDFVNCYLNLYSNGVICTIVIDQITSSVIKHGTFQYAIEVLEMLISIPYTSKKHKIFRAFEISVASGKKEIIKYLINNMSLCSNVNAHSILLVVVKHEDISLLKTIVQIIHHEMPNLPIRNLFTRNVEINQILATYIGDINSNDINNLSLSINDVQSALWLIDLAQLHNCIISVECVINMFKQCAILFKWEDIKLIYAKLPNNEGHIYFTTSTIVNSVLRNITVKSALPFLKWIINICQHNLSKNHKIDIFTTLFIYDRSFAESYYLTYKMHHHAPTILSQMIVKNANVIDFYKFVKNTTGKIVNLRHNGDELFMHACITNNFSNAIFIWKNTFPMFLCDYKRRNLFNMAINNNSIRICTLLSQVYCQQFCSCDGECAVIMESSAYSFYKQIITDIYESLLIVVCGFHINTKHALPIFDFNLIQEISHYLY